MNLMTLDEIKQYTKMTDVLDKAGGIDIETLPKKYIKKIDGDFDNVVGLPIQKILKIIAEL